MISHNGGAVRMYRLLCGGGGRSRSLKTSHTRNVAQHPTPASDSTPDAITNVEEDHNHEDVIEQKRNKSRLNRKHYSRMHQKPILLTEDEEMVETLNTQRYMYTQYGAASGISVGKLWPSKEELALEREWESLQYPHSIHEMITIAKKAREEEENALRKSQEDIASKVAKLEQWKADLRQRVARQEQLAQQAKAKKELLMEEVRKIFGFRIDPRDERFKEALEQKEKEEKKRTKAAKKLVKQQRMLDQLRKDASTQAGEEADKQADGEADKQAGGDGKSLSGTIIA